MAITLANPLSRVLNNKVFHRPLLLAALVSAGVVIWLGLSAFRVLVDQPLAPEKISAKRLRVNSAQLQSIQKNIPSYQLPSSTLKVRDDVFAPIPK